jgi:hypothetical protein
METFVPFVKRTITKENTFFRAKLELMLIIWTDMRPACTPKYLEKGVIRRCVEELFNRSFHVENTCRQAVNEKTGCKECITPKTKWNRRMSKKCKTSFNDVTMLAFRSTILLMSMRASNTMYDAKLLKERVEVAILAPPIRLNVENFVAK